jgi:hypothetical protein
MNLLKLWNANKIKINKKYICKCQYVKEKQYKIKIIHFEDSWAYDENGKMIEYFILEADTGTILGDIDSLKYFELISKDKKQV